MSKNPGRLVFYGMYPHIDMRLFEKFVTDLSEWSDFYPEVTERLPAKKIEPLGNPVKVRVYVDMNHTRNLKNRRSHSRILFYINNAPIIL